MSSSRPVISERERRPGGCRTPLVEPDLSAEQAGPLALLVKALADPTRLRIVDAVRKASPEAVCQCELLPLFCISQAALSKHLKVLLTAGLLGVERRGLWTYYFIAGETQWEQLRAWLNLTDTRGNGCGGFAHTDAARAPQRRGARR
jgi:ArsR family transcriptional regulator